MKKYGKKWVTNLEWLKLKSREFPMSTDPELEDAAFRGLDHVGLADELDALFLGPLEKHHGDALEFLEGDDYGGETDGEA